MSRALDKFQAQGGFTATTSTGTAVTGGYWAIQMLADTTFSSLLGNYDGTLTGVTIPAGMTIYGPFNGYTVGTGKVIAYKSVATTA
jgi:hypothetical protein